MKGKFITIQKYAHFTSETIMEILEVDVEVHCGPFVSPNGEDTKYAM